jgi:hypothetical protein
MFPAPCSEFPNDNPLLHDGAIFRVDDVCGVPIAEARAQEVVVEREVVVEPVVEVAVADAIAVEDLVEVVSRPSGIYLSDSASIEDDGDDIVIAPLEPLDEAEIYGAVHVESHAEIPPPSVVEIEEAPVSAAPIAACPFLQLVDIVCSLAARESAEVAASLRDSLVSGESPTANAWRAILRGESEDFGPCGALSLDEWAADVLARALSSPTRASLLRRDLRSAGVAAFGLVEAA